ncbi:hypothetical protein CLAVI_000583 [Candidatus Clavichlamydia salmonicola]|uniref:hypothetical protein n=1 Tax=Candidatus Clavichlamydia salmonicola TaxID=469812 RepID=UPI001890EF1B|nr:hypothetical protein [Candidatus Clavichlamydia salmonicola]MBF5050960.1 hypothetical protein [Candidatus Clavichlamydia salmonicola]
MSAGIVFWGREWPRDPSVAWRNIKDNMCNGWKITRLVTSALMSVGAAVLVSSCSTCVNEVDAGNNPSTANADSTTYSFDFNVLGTAAKVCFIGVCVYGAFSAIKFSLAIANKGIRLCIERRLANLDEDEEERRVNRSIEDMLLCFFPEILAGFMGVDYSFVVILTSMESSSGDWGIVNNVFGGISCGLYVLDTCLACFDMISLNIDEVAEQRLQVVQRVIPVPNGNGEGIPMVQIPRLVDVRLQGNDGGIMRGVLMLMPSANRGNAPGMNQEELAQLLQRPMLANNRGGRDRSLPRGRVFSLV